MSLTLCGEPLRAPLTLCGEPLREMPAIALSGLYCCAMVLSRTCRQQQDEAAVAGQGGSSRTRRHPLWSGWEGEGGR